MSRRRQSMSRRSHATAGPRRPLAIRAGWMLGRAARDVGRYPVLALLTAAALAWPLLGRESAATLAVAALVATVRAYALRTKKGLAARAWGRLLALLAAVVAAAVVPVWWHLASPTAAPMSWGRGVVWVAAVAAVAAVTDLPRRRARVMHRLREAVAEATDAEVYQVRPCVLPAPRWGSHWWQLSAPGRDQLDAVSLTWAPGLAGARTATRSLVATVAARELGPDVGATLATARRRILIERAPELPSRVESRPLTMGGQPPRVPVVAVGTPGRGLPTADDGTPLVLWDWETDHHCLTVGGTGGGKTSLVGSMIRTAILSGHVAGVTILDGKREGDYSRWVGRETVDAVATDVGSWLEALQGYVSATEGRHEEVRAWREDGAPRPEWHRQAHRWLLVVDELDAIVEALPQARDLLTLLLKTCRSAGGRVLVITQRPDISTSLPGSARDQLMARIVAGGAGALYRDGWGMVMEGAADAARRVVGAAGPDDPADAPAPAIPGRVVMRGSGRVVAGQAPWLPDPAESKSVEALMPPRRAGAPTEAPTADVIPLRPSLDEDPVARMAAAKAALRAEGDR